MDSPAIWVAPVTVALTLALVAVLVWTVRTNNRLVRQRNQVSASWAQIDVQLKRRHDLVPGLVETVRGAAAHERGTLEAVVNALGAALAVSTRGADQRAGAEGTLGDALGRLLTLAQAYPNLKASQNFAKLQTDLADSENRIAYARQFYNSAVQAHTTTIQSFPSSILAGARGFTVPEYFTVGDDDRDQVKVRF